MTAPPTAPGPLLPGLCSVTFRGRTIAEVAALAGAAGLQAVEWGGDQHVPPGDERAAAQAVRHSREHDLTIVSYGSYLFCDGPTLPALDAVLDTTEALGTSVVRVWCPFGVEPDVPPADRRRVTESVRIVAAAAAARDLLVYLEFHGGTLTATTSSTRTLLDAVGAPNLRTAWQPPYWDPRDDPEADRADAIHLRDALAHLHVYRWDHDGTRHPLLEGEDRWPAILSDAARAPTLPRHAPRAALLEFVADDEPAALRRDAATLRRWLDDA